MSANHPCAVCNAPTATSRRTCSETCRRETIRRAKTTHGESGSDLHRVWGAIVQRCTNPKAADYPNYGGRGIELCARWRSFETFLADMGERPEGATIDRKDNDGPYSPDNCEWSTQSEQARNRRSTRLVEFNGRTLSVIGWAEVTGLSRKTITNRLNRGWSVDRALTESAVVGKNQTGVPCT